MTHAPSTTRRLMVRALDVLPGDLLLPERTEVVSLEFDPSPQVAMVKFVTRSAPIYAGKASTQEVERKTQEASR